MTKSEAVTEIANEIQDVLANATAEKGSALTDQETDAVIEDMLSGIDDEPTGNSGENDMNRNETIEFLVTNCDCWKGDREALAKMSDAKLATLKANAEKHRDLEAVVNAIKEGFSAPADLTVNAMPAFIKEKIAAKKKKGDEEEEDGEEDMEANCDKDMEKKMAANKRLTANEWLKAAPPEIQSAVRNAMAIEQAEKDRHIAHLVANLEGDDKYRVMKRLKDKPLDELRDLIMVAAPTANRQQATPTNYIGAVGGPVENRGGDLEAPLDIDTARQSYDPLILNRKKASA